VNEDCVKKHFRPKGVVQEQLGRVAVVADAAHSFGAEYKGKRCGSVADITVFSYHAVKNLTTAEGGAICLTMPSPFNNAEVYKTLRLWSLNGQTKDAFSKTQAGGWRYDIVYPGFKFNMPDVCAAIGLAQIRKYQDNILEERKRVFNYYKEFFNQQEWAETPPFEKEGYRCSYHLYPLRIKNISEQQRDNIIEIISNKGIAVNVHFIPLPLLTIFKERGVCISKFPGSYNNFSREISLPIYPQLDNNMCQHIVSAVSDAVLNLGK
jgi:dTDP-4-amino-4,6-dideoxygalactose transaminase